MTKTSLTSLPVDVQRHIYQRAPDRQTMLTLQRVCKTTRNAVAHSDATVNDDFNKEWLKNLSDDQVMHVWEKCIERDGRNAGGEIVPGRRELQFAQLTEETVRATYPQSHLAIALLRSLELKNEWFLDRLSSPVTMLVPINMSTRHAERIPRELFGSIHAWRPWAAIRLQVIGRYQSDAQICYHMSGSESSRGGVLQVRDITYPPSGDEDGLAFPAMPASDDPITLILGTPPGLDSSPHRFVFGLRAVGSQRVMLGINPHAGSWDEMVVDCMHWGSQIDGFIEHLLAYPLDDMNLADSMGISPMRNAFQLEMPGVILRLLQRPEIDLNEFRQLLTTKPMLSKEMLGEILIGARKLTRLDTATIVALTQVSNAYACGDTA